MTKVLERLCTKCKGSQSMTGKNGKETGMSLIAAGTGARGRRVPDTNMRQGVVR